MKPNPPITKTRSIPRRCHPDASTRKRFPQIAWRLPLLLSLALIGCAAESKVSRVDPDLGYAALREGVVAVLGVVKPQEVDQVRPPLIAMLETALSEERRDLPLLRADRVRELLGKEPHHRILLAYEFQGVLDSAAVRELADSLRGHARFVVVARVESDQLRYSSRETSETDSAGVPHVIVRAVTGRDARVSVQLYDLAKGTIALNAKYMGSSESDIPIFTGTGLPGRGPGVSVGVAPQVTPAAQGYPDPPELARSVEGPFRNFARALPKAAP
jgi:hypothetical protein